MLSVVVVGRNDSHGYNLSKRVASSLNSIARPMTGNDEIIFVDWNSDDFNPPFVDSIMDTLTEQTRKHLIVYRIRNSVHKQFSKESRRPILEPIARNVGIRRAKNPWILSTNTDMVFDTNEQTYFDILETLQPNLYHLYRYEIPEYIWEQFNRYDPNSVIRDFLTVIAEKNLIRKVGTRPHEDSQRIFPDAVGDFQLAPREFWERVEGFPEDMLMGWHVDSRLSFQMERLLRTEAEILDDNIMKGFHQNHLRVLTHFHSQSAMNSTEVIVKSYSNGEFWGLSKLNLSPESKSPRFSLAKLETNSSNSRLETLDESKSSVLYNQDIALMFLLDEFENIHPYSRVGYLSLNPSLIVSLQQATKKCGLEFIDLRETPEHLFALDIVLLDFGISNQSKLASLGSRDVKAFLSLVCNQLRTLKPGIRVVSIRAQHWTVRSLLREYCHVPLFNNYSMILAGNVKKNQGWRFWSRLLDLVRLQFLARLFYIGHIPILGSPYESTERIRQHTAFNSKVFSFIYLLYKKLPDSAFSLIRSKLKKILKVY